MPCFDLFRFDRSTKNEGGDSFGGAALYNRVSVLKWCHRTLSPTFPSILREKDARGVTPKMMAEIRGHTASVEYLSRALSAEGEFHVKRVDKVQTAMKLGVSVKYLQ